MHYGYIGLGNLGGHLAASLLQAGHRVTVFDRNLSLIHISEPTRPY